MERAKYQGCCYAAALFVACHVVPCIGYVKLIAVWAVVSVLTNSSHQVRRCVEPTVSRQYVRQAHREPSPRDDVWLFLCGVLLLAALCAVLRVPGVDQSILRLIEPRCTEHIPAWWARRNTAPSCPTSTCRGIGSRPPRASNSATSRSWSLLRLPQP